MQRQNRNAPTKQKTNCLADAAIKTADQMELTGACPADRGRRTLNQSSQKIELPVGPSWTLKMTKTKSIKISQLLADHYHSPGK